ncbi:winged helix-turn-helix domain-containing protein [Georgenia sp. Z1491]|uniref:winged helix-turn-helix domain-containing protein n=1 Tax=Georgenia sp. Z1491 TaxID=3416707 RepID=UPI003CF20335
MQPQEISIRQVRRAAVAAQGLARRRPARPGRRHVARAVADTALLQIDSVNVLARAHQLPVLARVGAYDTSILDRVTGRSPRLLVETWCHEASLVPPRTYALQAARRSAAEDRWQDRGFGDPALMADVEAAITDHGAATSTDLHDLLAHERAEKTAWGWNWSPLKVALSRMWRTGRLAVARRSSSFEQVLDLPGRVLPPEALAAAPPWPEAVRELTLVAARAHGVAGVRALADYHRLPVRETATAVRALVEDGELVEVRVRGLRRPAYRPAEVTVPADPVRARALLAPFDPLVFERERLADLWGMHYRIGIYTPAHLRSHGYYVLPFLLGEHLVARVDLKADRAAGVLLVKEVHAEDPGQVPDLPSRGAGAWPSRERIAEELAAELGEVARWLGADRVDASGGVGDLARDLHPAVLRSAS